MKIFEANKVNNSSGNRSKARTIKIAISLIAVVVIFATSFMMLLPAMTMEKASLTCEKEEHVHTDACYEKTLICTEVQTDEQSYTDENSDAVSDLNAAQEMQNHEHTDSCYETTLSCNLEEHTHTSDCYTENNLNQVAATKEDSNDPLKRTYEDEKVVINVFLQESSNIPEDAVLTVVPFSEQDNKEKYDLMINEIETQMFEEDQSINSILLYDISFILNGEEIEPQNSVKVSINYKDKAFETEKIERASDLMILHMKEDAENIEVEDLTQTITGVEEGVKTIEFVTESFSTYAVVLVDTTITGTFYKRVSSIDDYNANYLIVSSTGSYALTDASTNHTQVIMVPVKGVDNNNKEYFSTDSQIQSNMLFNFISRTGGAVSVRSRGANARYVYLASGTVFSYYSQNLNMTYYSGSSSWKLYSGSYSLSNDGTSFSRSNYGDNTREYQFKTAWKYLTIYQQVETTLFIPADIEDQEFELDIPWPESETAPIYNDYIDTSNIKDGSYTASDDKEIIYISDKATSQIENDEIFKNREEDDGKIWTDKSVTYGVDDYGAFKNYADGEFGVTLSALSQTYSDENHGIYDVPVDVVFVLDFSNSMNEEVNGKTRIEILIKSLNDTINKIMRDHPENRVGIAHYSDVSGVMLPLGRYYCGSGTGDPDYTAKDYFKVNIYSEEDIYVLKNDNLRDADTKEPVNMSAKRVHGGTYLQQGLQHGANIFLSETDTTYTFPNKVVVNRLPVCILLSDGSPTFASSNFMDPLTGPHYGNGNGDGVATSNKFNLYPDSDGINAKGVMGYYSILSANHFKSVIGIHYNRSAKFGSVGIGIHDGVTTDLYTNSEYPKRIIGDDYNRAILNPSEENIRTTKANPNSDNTPFGPLMTQLLGNTYFGTSILVNPSSETYVLGALSFGPTNALIPVIKNPYGKYDYADFAYFRNQVNEVELTGIFDDILNESKDTRLYYGGFLKENTSLDFTDIIGKDMEVKGDMVIRYQGTNYSLERIKTTNNPDGTITNEYRTVQDVTVTNAVGKKVSLRDAKISIITDASGQQKVSFKISNDLLPAYRKALSQNYYFEMLPIRLIFKVGLTAEAASDIIPQHVYYTNEWKNGETTTATFTPNEDNPYYKTGENDDQVYTKEDNATDTISSYFSSAKNTSDQIVISMGNNGLLQNTHTNKNIEVTVEKKWLDGNGNEIADTSKLPAIEVQLYRMIAETGVVQAYGEPVTLNHKGSWKYTWRRLPAEDIVNHHTYSYYVEETNLRADYDVSYIGNDLGDTGTITIVNKEKNTKITVNKVWRDSNGIVITGDDHPAVTVTLYRKVDGGTDEIVQIENNPVVLNQGVNWRHVWTDVPIADDDGNEYVYYIVEDPVFDSNNNMQRYVTTYKVNNGPETPSSGDITGTNNTVTVINQAEEFKDVKGSITITKRWRDIYGNEITDTSDFSEITVMIRRRVGLFVPGTTQFYVSDQGDVKSVKLNYQNNWTVTVDDLETTYYDSRQNITFYYFYYIREIAVPEGFEVSYSSNNIFDNKGVNGNYGIQEGEIVITNQSNSTHSVLPETGSIGTMWYTAVGLSLLSIPLLWFTYRVIHKRRAKKE